MVQLALIDVWPDPGDVLTRPPPFRQASVSALDALRPPARSDPAKWIPRNVNLPASMSATPGPYSLFMYPYQRGPVEAFYDRKIRVLVFCWGTQLGKTTMPIVFVIYIAAQDPSPMIWAGPVEPLLDRQFDTKIWPMCRACDAVSAQLPSEHGSKRRTVKFAACTLLSAISGSPSELGDASARYVFINEIDKFSTKISAEGDPVDLVRERCKAFTRHKIIEEGTPTEAGVSRLERRMRESDERRYWIPCPGCGRFFVLEHEGLDIPKDLHGRYMDERTVRAETRFPCPHCTRSLADHEKLPCMQRGVWARDGEGVEPDGSIVVRDAERVAGHGDIAGFYLNSLYSPAISFGHYAATWREAVVSGNVGKIRNFVNGWMGRVYTPNTKVASSEVVLRHRGLESGLGYAMDECPQAPLVWIMTVDVQQNSLWYQVWAWCANHVRYLIRYGQLPSGLNNLLPLMRPRYRIAGGDGRKYRPDFVLIDSGWGERTHEVYRFCAENECIPLKGAEGARRAQSVSWTRIGPSEKEGKSHDAVNLMMVSVDVFKDQLLAAMLSDNLDGPGAWRLHSATGNDFAMQMCSEQRRREVDPRGRPRWVWRQVSDDNHHFDLAVYNEAAAYELEVSGQVDFSEEFE